MHIRKIQLTSLFSILALSTLLGGCLNTGQVDGVSTCSALGPCSTSGASPSPVVNPPAAGGGGGTTNSDSPFKVSIKSYWDDDAKNEYPTSYPLKLIHPATKDVPGSETTLTTVDCAIPSDADPVGKSDYVDPSTENISNLRPYFKAIRTCGVEIPELKLYFSKLEFTVDAPKGHSCDAIHTYPNYYLASRSKNFVPPWNVNTTIDCEATGNFLFPTNKDCYVGAATKLINGFPLFAFSTETSGASDSNPVRPKYQKKWLVDSAFKSLNGYFYEGNKWTAFQPKRITPFPQWGSTIENAWLLDDSRWISRRLVGNSQTWHFQCVHEGNNLSYQYEIRIIPKPDSNLNPGAPRVYSWLNDSGSILDNPTAISAISPNKGPVEGGLEVSLSGPSISTSDALILCKEGTDCTQTIPPYSPKLFCAIDSKIPGKCTLPALTSSADYGAYRIWYSKSNNVMVGSSATFEYVRLTLTDVTPTTGPASGGTEITLTGTGIAKDAKITIGGANCPIVTDSLTVDSTEVRCTVAAQSLKTGVATLDKEIKIENPTSKQSQALGTFTFFRPVITSVSGGPCTTGSTCTVTVNGTFPAAGNSYSVELEGNVCSGLSGGALSCSFTPSAAGSKTVSIKVTDALEQTATASKTITVTAPAP